MPGRRGCGSIKRSPIRAASDPVATDARGFLRMSLDLGTGTGLVPIGWAGVPLSPSRESGNPQHYAILRLSIDDPTKEGSTYDGCTGSEKRRRRGAVVARRAGHNQGHCGGHRREYDRSGCHRSPWGKSPMHVHHREDEASRVLEGEVTFEVGGRTIRRAPATLVRPARHPPSLRGGRGWLPNALCPHPRRLRGSGQSDERSGPHRPLPPADHPMPDEEQMMAAQAAAGCNPVG